MKPLARLFSGLVLLVFSALLIAALFFRTPIPPIVQPPLTGQIDHITIQKAARKMVVYRGGVALKSYDIALGSAPIGDKSRQGDGRTPEGVFRIDRRNTASRFHLSLGLDYPQAADRKRAAAGGYSAGGDIMIHGQPNGIPVGAVMRGDWTAGCIAVTNDQIVEIFAATQTGVTVEITP